nr:T9SS type A sorting domain-containing protein [Bacteroidota bacterium]
VYHPVALGPDPIYANFIAEDTLVEPGDTVQFSDLSNDAETWEWDFDNDGTIDSYEQNPNHTYEDLGYYTVKLSITGEGGIIQDYGIRYDYIHVDNLINTDFIGGMDDKISIYPNPLRDHLNISIRPNQTDILDLRIYDSNGKLIRFFDLEKDRPQGSILIPVTDLQNGIYFLKMGTPEQSQTKKIIINH